jgi:hypothetical protein
VSDEQIKLYALARCVMPTTWRLRTYRDAAPYPVPMPDHDLLTVEATDSQGVSRWFGLRVSAVRTQPDDVLARELARAVKAG